MKLCQTMQDNARQSNQVENPCKSQQTIEQHWQIAVLSHINPQGFLCGHSGLFSRDSCSLVTPISLGQGQATPQTHPVLALKMRKIKYLNDLF